VTKRIWVVDYTGRLGNRLRLLTHLAAAALEYGLTISNPAFWKYRHEFEAWKRNGLNFFPGHSEVPVPARLERVLRGGACRLADWAGMVPGLPSKVGWLRCRDEEQVDLASPGFREKLAQGPQNLFLWGYNFHGARLVQKHRQELLRLFRARNAVHPAGGLRIGLHARRGDYRGWSGGRFFFEWDRYLGWVRQAREVWAQRSPRIVIFSDEKVPEEILREPGVESAQGSPGQDLFLMASCDVILGPPSSFSDWAAWYGGVGRLRIERAEQVLKAENVVKVEVP